MKAGKLDKRLDIEQPISVQDANGSPIVTWLPVGTVWALISPIRGREALTSNQIMPHMDTRITIRQHPLLASINAKWRLRYDGIIYNIVSVSHINLGNREIEIMCTSGENDG
jgi:SPP1 family predicted phage head-tail adaptor